MVAVRVCELLSRDVRAEVFGYEVGKEVGILQLRANTQNSEENISFAVHISSTESTLTARR